ALPGVSSSVNRLRANVLDFCCTPTARALNIRGPIGVGKSTLARIVGFLKRLAPLIPQEAERMISDVRFDATHRIDIRIMPWYVELALTGLVESLADTQLFGVVKGAFTVADQSRPGVFERPRGALGAGATGGGVVFL